MDWETFEKHKAFAGERKPSMLRRRIGHDYESRRIYLITMTVEGRQPLLGRLVGKADAPQGSAEAPRIELSPLGQEVAACWLAISKHYPSVRVLATMVMPDHLHGILFVEQQMEQHLGMVIKGFKAGCNKAYRRLFPLHSQSPTHQPSPTHQSSPMHQSSSMLQQCCSTENRKKGYLWSRNYNDHILEGPGELSRWFDYLQDNPRRLAVRREHPEFFRVQFNITIGGQSYAAIGNRFLLDYPEKEQVQCSRSLTDMQITAVVQQMLAKARRGVILVSPAISKGEQAVMRAALNARLPLIFLTPWGFNDFSRPGHQYYEACAEGRFLILAPWQHQNQRLPLTRDMCLQLNAMTKEICNYRTQT